ncbi:Lrp/AsnC family transcriptional regulator [Candidatus Woesearchaeota archaeon]|nr:Lrp/AsnC family transcriptional regulator [Candidatus Woesearchaeota archaeon]
MVKNLNSEHRILYELSLNARIKKKELSQKLKKSPQLLGYSIDKLKSDKKIINSCLQIDPAKFGLINVLLLLNYTTFEKDRRREFLSALKEMDNITHIETLSHRADLLIEFTVPNLSQFNKLEMNLMQRFGKDIKLVNVYPVIVKHKFPPKYLSKRTKEYSSMILSGDRVTIEINKNEKKVLLELLKDPESTILDISKKTKLNVRTIISTIKRMENKKIIRGYTITLDFEKNNISACNLLINMNENTPKEIDKFVEFSKQIPEVVRIYKLIGRNSILVNIQSLKDYKHVINQLREEFKFHDYQVYDIVNVLKNNYIPFSILE